MAFSHVVRASSRPQMRPLHVFTGTGGHLSTFLQAGSWVSQIAVRSALERHMPDGHQPALSAKRQPQQEQLQAKRALHNGDSMHWCLAT